MEKQKMIKMIKIIVALSLLYFIFNENKNKTKAKIQTNSVYLKSNHVKIDNTNRQTPPFERNKKFQKFNLKLQ